MKRWIHATTDNKDLGSSYKRYKLAQTTSDAELLERLADDPDIVVRREVVIRSDDPKLLSKFSDDEDWLIRRRVAQKTDDINILEKLSNDDSWEVRMTVAVNKYLPSDILDKLAEDENEHVREAAEDVITWRSDFPDEY